MEAPDALTLYKLHDSVRALEQALRKQVEAGNGTRGEWGAIRSLESACYYLFGAAGWMLQDLNAQERLELEQQLELLSPHGEHAP